MRNILVIFAALAAWLLITGCGEGNLADPRLIRAAEVIDSALLEAGLADAFITSFSINRKHEAEPGNLNRESFQVTLSGDKLDITGSGPAGVLYGSLEAAGRIRRENGMPDSFTIIEQPHMHMRGIGLLLMKLGTYNYPVTPEEFPFFYDRGLWLETLDFLGANRYNYIAFWNGHPFAYFVDLPQYPEAQDGMDGGLIERNRDQLHWLIREAWKRNIRIFFEFYNIHTSVYFQQHHNLPDETREPTPQLAAYTAYSIEQFCREFPDAGLYITAGEGLDPDYSGQWVNDVIMPALERSGSHPPVMLRSWFLDLEHAEEITRRHPEIYIERKYNVEMIAGRDIDPAYRIWDELTGSSIVNIHMAANLEPFRWNPPGYIRACMQSSLDAGADGIHLYPRKPWRWPYGSDLGDSSYQWVRDRLWYQMWARYAWNPGRDPVNEKEFWIRELAGDHIPGNAARLILEAFELSADVLPAIQRLFWAGHDNHTVVTAGLLVAQIEIAEGIPFLPLDPVVPVNEYLDASWSGNAPDRIKSDSILRMKISECKLALEKMDEAINLTDNQFPWLLHYRNDMEAMLLTARFYEEKLHAVKYRNKFMEDLTAISNREEFLRSLARSVNIFRELTALTCGTYESLSDVPAVNPVKLEVCPYHWSDLLPLYEEELRIYKDLIMEAGGKDFDKPVFRGLAGIWYGDPGLRKPKFRFGTDRIAYLWEKDEKKPEGGRNWSVEWFGYLLGPVDGEVTLLADADQVLRVRVGDQLTIDRTATNGATEAKITMAEGEAYPVEIVYDHTSTIAGHVTLSWKFGEHGEQVIEGKYFKHSKADLFRVDRKLIQPAYQRGL